MAKPASLSGLLAGIDAHMIALPQFQRPWRWEPERVRELIVSVAYRYPAGSLLTMPVTTAQFALRPFDGAGEELRDTPNLMVLDGQQRLTSLYQALFRQDGVRYNNRRFHFYLDIPYLLSDPDGSIEVGDPYFEGSLFYVQLDKGGHKVRYDGLVRRYNLNTRAEEFEAGALPLSLIFDANGQLAKWKKDYLVEMSDHDMDRYLELNDTWDALVQTWIDRIRNYPFPEIQLRADMPLSAICHIFEKVNSTGMPLDVFDLCTAILWAQGFFLNERWEETVQAFSKKNILPMQSLSGTAFLQGISLLESLEMKRGSPGERIAVTCRKHDLMNLKRATLERWWDTLVQGYIEASKFMTNEGILSPRILPYTTMIIPLSAIFADIKRRKGEVNLGTAWEKVRRWYWCSVFGQRYSGPVETNSALDLEEVVSWVDGGPEPEVVRTFTFRSDVLQEISSIRNAIYKGILCLLASQGAKDFGGKGKLTTALFYDTNQDHHHIFPLDSLKQMGIVDNRTNTIVNKTLISAAVNRSISGRNPSDYLRIWRKKLGQESFDDILTTHLIASSPMDLNSWPQFVADRREKLRQLIEATCGGVFQPFSDYPDINQPLDDMTPDDVGPEEMIP